MRSIRVLSLAGSLVTLLVMVLGRIVRVTGASMACPDWPLCNGALVPEMNLLVFLEFTHRLMVLGVAVITVAIVVVAWRHGGGLRAYTLGCLVLLFTTAIVGGLSVLYPLGPAGAALDQALAQMAFASLVALTTWCYALDRTPSYTGSSETLSSTSKR